VKKLLHYRGIAVNRPFRANFDPARLVIGALIALALAVEIVALTAWALA
jgi:hypothetical protein